MTECYNLHVNSWRQECWGLGMFCPKCGKSVGESDTFCERCGKQIQSNAQPTATSPASPKVQPQRTTLTAAQPPGQLTPLHGAPLRPPTKISIKGKAAVIGAIVVLVIICAAVVSTTKNYSKRSSSTSSKSNSVPATS